VFVRGDVEHWVEHLTPYRSYVRSNPINGSFCLLEQEMLPLLLSTRYLTQPNLN